MKKLFGAFAALLLLIGSPAAAQTITYWPNAIAVDVPLFNSTFLAVIPTPALTSSATNGVADCAGIYGKNNVGLGELAAASLTNACYATAVGYKALNANQHNVASTVVGALSFQLVNSTANGDANSSIGYEDYTSMTTGSFNFGGGNSVFQNCVTCNNDTAIGAHAGLTATAANDQVLLGSAAGYGMTTPGAGNILIGTSNSVASLNQVTTGGANISITYDGALASATASNQLDIGNYIYGTGFGSATGATISTAKVGIGIKAPAVELDVAGAVDSTKISVINLSGASAPSIATGTGVLQMVGPSSGAATVQLDGAAGAITWLGRVSGGTIASPSATTSGTILARIGGAGYGTSLTGIRANIAFTAAEIWSGTAQGSRIDFNTSAAGQTATSTKWYLWDTGDWLAADDNSYDIGANGANRPRSVYVGTNAKVGGAIINTGISTDATHTDATVCEDTTSHQFYFGSGAAGICLGTSSLRYKTHVRTLHHGLAEVLKLRSISYRYKPGYGTADRDLYGFAAEEVAKVLPDLVSNDGEGRPNSVDWAGVVPVLVKAIQDQQSEIVSLKAANDNLEIRMSRLEKLVASKR